MDRLRRNTYHENALDILRHSAAHLFAQAARRLFPDIHLGVGPAIQDGFYYDTDNTAGQISNESASYRRRNEEDCQGKFSVNPRRSNES